MKDKFIGLTVDCPSCDQAVSVPDPDEEKNAGLFGLMGASDDKKPGFFLLAFNLLTQPIGTMRPLFSHLATVKMLAKTLLFYGSSLAIVALAGFLHGESAGEFMLRNFIELLIYSISVTVLGRMMGGAAANGLGMLAVFMFIYGLTNWFLMVVVGAGYLGLMNIISFTWILVTYNLWRLFLYLLALVKGFGIGLYRSIFITFVCSITTEMILASLLPF